jgi:hypothetical protein
VMAVVIDGMRTQAARKRMVQKLDVIAIETPEQIAIRKCECTELWRLISHLAVTVQERTIVHECFVLELPPRAILSRHPDLFTDINSVYTAKRNLLNRLRRNPDLRQFTDHDIQA